jgi:hypothetical protein
MQAIYGVLREMTEPNGIFPVKNCVGGHMDAFLEAPSALSAMPEASDYEVDYLLWMRRQLLLLRAGKFEQLDIDNLLQEMELAVSHQRSALKSRLYVLIVHLLKLQMQAKRQSPSWYSTIVEQRLRIELLLEKSPSLQPSLPEFVEWAYPRAVRFAANETGIDPRQFPEQLPFTVDQLLDPSFFP